MVAGVAHEISTPLSVSLISASCLRDRTGEFYERYRSGGLTISEAEKYAKKAVEASSIVLSNLGRAVDLLNSFKNVAADQIVQERRNFDLRESIEDTLNSLRPKYRRTACTIKVECPENLKITSYPGAFSQIITNLLMNSLIHGFEGIEEGEIVLSADKRDNMLLFTYRDTGRGMDKTVVNRIFDPFFTTSRSKGGIGLGMHIVHNLVYQTLKGRIECKSSPGKGTEFAIEIPLTDEIKG
jgi:signal transduction histidine kinase